MTPYGFSPDVKALNLDVFPGMPTGKKIKLRVEHLDGEPKFRSKFEQRVWREWIPLQNPAVALYEPWTFHIAGGNYTPDFVLVMRDGELWLIEAKESWDAYISGRSSKHNLKQAAEEFAWLGHWFALTPVMERRPNKKGKLVWRAVGRGFALHEYGGDDEKAIDQPSTDQE